MAAMVIVETREFVEFSLQVPGIPEWHKIELLTADGANQTLHKRM